MKSLFLLFAGALACCAADSPAVVLSPASAEHIRAAIARGESWTTEPVARLRAEVRRDLKLGPWTVTASRPKNHKIDAHDYYSEGTYWWPDPKNPGGPYIRKDGHTYPGRFMDNKNAMNAMAESVFTLGTAAYLLDDAPAAAHAAKVLSVWFVDPATRMNPHLEYGQAIPGVNEGRGGGIIDTRAMIRAAQGIALLERSGKLDAATRDSVHRWYSDFTKWLTTSKKGLSEKNSGNNHASWWTAQVAAYSALTGDRATLDMAFNWYRTAIFPKQIEKDGAAPREEARTKSLGYSAFNLEAYSVLCRIAEQQGVDLWSVRTAAGAGIPTVIGYLAPALADAKQWKKEQITNFDNNNMYYLAFAGMGMKRPEWVKMYRDHAGRGDAWQALVNLMVGEWKP